MHRWIATLRARSTERILKGTTFCEESSQVCPPDCRRESLRDQQRMNVQRAGLYHL
jgi:hypothetical protein